jgi:hypothetical protein
MRRRPSLLRTGGASLLVGALMAATFAAAGQVQDTSWNGVKVDLVSAKRTSGGTVTISFKYSNTRSTPFNYLAATGLYNLCDQVYFVDPQNKRKYLVVKDSQGNSLATAAPFTQNVAPGESQPCWAKLPAPPANVNKISIFVPGAPPFEDVSLAAQ